MTLDTWIEGDGYKFSLVLVYLDVTCNARNDYIHNELNTLITQHDEDSKLLVSGDFNGHLGFLGRQNLDRNGRFVLDLLDRHNLILLNADDKCSGEVTREENGQKSAMIFSLLIEKCMINLTICILMRIKYSLISLIIV